MGQDTAAGGGDAVIRLADLAAQIATTVAGVPIEFLLFGMLLLAIAFLHRNTTAITVAGAVVITLYQLVFSTFAEGPGVGGLLAHAAHEWVALANLLGLLLGFTLLARHVENSGVPELLPACLPDDARGGFFLLAGVFVLSAVLDNIAAAIIGAGVARVIFRGRVHVGFLASLVACANAGGVGSVLGDTTTTMMWIAGVGPLQVLPGYVAAGVALLVTAIPAARQQQAWAAITTDAPAGLRVDKLRLSIVAAILGLVVLSNLLMHVYFRQHADSWPILATALWAGIVLTALLRRPDWTALPEALRGAIFLLALVWCASLMPVGALPAASWQSTLAVGYLSAVLDNIPLTALALKQGGYDWAMLAYAVGFGGSMLWFGSSAGVAVASRFPEAKSAWLWLRHGWHVVLAYPLGFAVMLALVGWHPAPGVMQRSAGAPAKVPARDRLAVPSGLRMQGSAADFSIRSSTDK